jgi:Ca2+/Na+ antiporter
VSGTSEGARVVIGGLLLYFGAEWFVAGASALALALRIPELLVGLTVVAYGTSAPEIIVGVEAAAAGHGQVALANVLGSNIANIGLILGLAGAGLATLGRPPGESPIHPAIAPVPGSGSAGGKRRSPHIHRGS